MTKSLTILFFSFLTYQTHVAGQIIEQRKADDFDSTLLSPECKLDKEQLGKIFTRLEILAEFPGGFNKWFDFANNNYDFHYVMYNMGDTVQKFQDSLVIKFVVTRNGNICNINVQKGNPLLTEPTLKLLKSSPNWKPGLNGGRQLNSFRTLRVDVYIDKQQNIKTIKHYTNSYFKDNDR